MHAHRVDPLFILAAEDIEKQYKNHWVDGQKLQLHHTRSIISRSGSLSTYDEEYNCSPQIYDYLPLLLNNSILHHLSSRKRVVPTLLAPFIMITAASVPVWVCGPDVVASSAVLRHEEEDPHWQTWLTHQNLLLLPVLQFLLLKQPASPKKIILIGSFSPLSLHFQLSSFK